MRTRGDVSAAKLRGSFPTPPDLVARCLDRLDRLSTGTTALRALEPAAGDGAFVRALASHPLGRRVAHLVAYEPDTADAHRCARALDASGIAGETRPSSALALDGPAFDLAFGNPPFVRFQFVSGDDRRAAGALASRLGIRLQGVTNLWVAVLFGALTSLRDGGAFAFVVPAECFTGVSAGVLRAWLAAGADELTVDLFAPGSFPGVVQEIVVLSGRRASRADTRLRIRDHGHVAQRSWTHTIDRSERPWTRWLLTPEQLDALEHASAAPGVAALGDIARFEVAAVTGANDFFSVDAATCATYSLGPWARPLLPRFRHAPGLVYRRADQEATVASGARGGLLDFSADAADPLASDGPRRYLEHGVDAGLPLRFKCRIRRPWFRVPSVRPGSLMLSKRTHRDLRLVANPAGVVTTDTIYRGDVVDGRVSAATLVASFHNSLTLLSAELEGRSFGGGVLELVPSEIARLRTPIVAGAGAHLDRLDAIARRGDPDAVTDATDAVVTTAIGSLDVGVLDSLRGAHEDLRTRRLARAARRVGPGA